MEFGVVDILTMVGALGFFIYGMKVMSEGIQSVAGDRMRNILGVMTSNRFSGLLSGILITALVQSSSATTVMVVSFVNAGLLNLGQSIGIIMGANIGTTVTSWLISLLGLGKFKISSVALPIIAIGFPLMFSKNPKHKNWAEVIIGFALLFIGLTYLKDAMPDLQKSPEALAFIKDINNLGFLAVPVSVLIGTLLTIVVQSSSAAMAITLIMVDHGWIPLDMACAIVLGENIGTTITANLAAMIGNVHAKRAARAHLVFNIFGVVWMILLFPFFVDTVKSIMSGSFGSYLVDKIQGDNSFNTISLSLFHTLFNVCNVAFLIGFVNTIRKVVIRMVPARSAEDEELHLEYMGEGIASSIQEAREEVKRFGALTAEISEFVQKMIHAKKDKDRVSQFEKIKKYEQRTDELKAEVASYLSKIAESSVIQGDAMGVQELMSIIDDLERTADIYLRIGKAVNKRISKNINFTDKQFENLDKMSGLVDSAFKIMNGNLTQVSKEEIDQKGAFEMELEIDQLRKTLRKENIKAIENNLYSIKSGMLYYDMIFSFELIGNHIYNVTKDIADFDA
ncbi:MAG: Na/Pi cotransporter family protein [Cytophagales bacterium]|nr:Na/Pi cotransporter family protein [Cytophagales bacterium]